MPRHLGIDLGAETLKLAELTGASGAWTLGRRCCLPHFKDPGPLLQATLASWGWDDLEGAAVTGRLGRQVALPRIPTQQALASGFRLLHGPEPATLASIGSRGFSILELREGGRQVFRENGRCAQGTGNFLQQLVGRFGLDVAEAAALAEGVAEPAALSGRCPVILKTDMTHLANQGEARERILAGLLDAIAENVQGLIRPRVCPRKLCLAGGVARSLRIRRHFELFAQRQGLVLEPGDPEEGLYLEAFGAALLSAELPHSLPALDALLVPRVGAAEALLPSLTEALGRVRRMPAQPPPSWDGTRDVLLGFDIGSTGAKAVALDLETGRALWDAYGGTDGAPVEAARKLMGRFLDSPAAGHRVLGFGVTGSGREIVGSLLSSCYGPDQVFILNEIAAHATGALAVDPRVDTIFEIGGQDAKYIRLEGGRVVDAAMNEACSAGTGSFIEEQGRRFQGVEDVVRMGEAALAADAAAALGQHCSIFMAEVMDEAVASGVPQERILAGVYHSVVANYLNRVKGSRSVGQVVFCQGMPFASDALAAAVASQTGAEVIVPPAPGLMGALGIALLARDAFRGGERPAQDGSRFLGAQVEAKDKFVCGSTQGCGGTGNKCRIERITTRVAGERRTFTWGGGCSLWDKGVRRVKLPDLAPDPFRERRALTRTLLDGLAPLPERPVVAFTDEFQLQGLLPFFAVFIHALGFQVRVLAASGRTALKRGVEEAAIPFCAPMQQYHGLVAELAEGRPDYLFLPMIRELPRVDGEAHACICPITQGAPDVLRLNLGEGAPRILSPVVDHGTGFLDSKAFLRSCGALATELGCPDWRRAWALGRAAQAGFEADLLELGTRALAFCRERNVVPVVVLGRGYTIHNEVLNANVPALLREQGALAIPVDCLPLPPDTPTFHEVYWGFSQRILRAAWAVRGTPGLYSLFCSNYACGPDSFTVHTFGWLMEGKPFAVIETDGHAGDAGTRTRVEAFLHCVREDLARPGREDVPDPARLEIGTLAFGELRREGETLLVPFMGPSSEAAAAALRGLGVPAEVLPQPDARSLQAGRRHTSGKECLPMTLTLGTLLERLEQDREGRFLFLMPSACGPCRLGAYRTLDRLVLDRLGFSDRVRIWSPPWGDYFQGLPPGFSALIFTGIVAMGVLDEALGFVRPAEREPGLADAVHARWSRRLTELLETQAAGDLSRTRVVCEVASGRAYGLPALLREALADLAGADTGASLPRVLVTGEIYVRLDPFANGFVSRELGRRGLRVLLEPSSEVLRYSAHTAWVNGEKAGLGDQVEGWIQDRLHALCVRETTAALPLPPRPPVREVLHAAAPYLRDALEGEAVLSLGGPLHAWRRGEIDAAVLVGPLECMPNKLAEAQFVHVAEREGLPVLSLAMTGEALDPEALDNFVFLVRRRFLERERAALPG